MDRPSSRAAIPPDYRATSAERQRNSSAQRKFIQSKPAFPCSSPIACKRDLEAQQTPSVPSLCAKEGNGRRIRLPNPQRLMPYASYCLCAIRLSCCLATKATSGYELFSNGCNVSRTSERPMSPATTAALFALRWGATGIGFWCYNIGADSWQRVANDYPIVYPGRTKPV